VDGTKILLEKMYTKGCKRFICASSTAIYGNEPAPYYEDTTKLSPLNAYAKSKVAMESCGLEFATKHPDVKFIALRYCNVYGPGERHKGHRASMIYHLARAIIARETPKLFRDGSQKRDWIYVDDVVRANICALNYDKSNIFNCGYGQACSFNQLITWMNEELYRPPLWMSCMCPKYIDNPHADKYQNFTECNMDKAERELGFKPQISPQEGIKRYLHSLKFCKIFPAP